MKYVLPALCLLIAGSLPAQSDTLEGSWKCTDVSDEPVITEARVTFRADGSAKYALYVQIKEFGITFQVGVRATGKWEFDGSLLKEIIDHFDFNQLNIGGKDMRGTRTEEDVRRLLDKDIRKNDDPATVRFHAPDQMTMTTDSSLTACVREKVIPLSRNAPDGQPDFATVEWDNPSTTASYQMATRGPRATL